MGYGVTAPKLPKRTITVSSMTLPSRRHIQKVIGKSHYISTLKASRIGYRFEKFNSFDSFFSLPSRVRMHTTAHSSAKTLYHQ